MVWKCCPCNLNDYQFIIIADSLSLPIYKPRSIRGHLHPEAFSFNLAALACAHASNKFDKINAYNCRGITHLKKKRFTHPESSPFHVLDKIVAWTSRSPQLKKKTRRSSACRDSESSALLRFSLLARGLTYQFTIHGVSEVTFTQ